MTMINPYFGNEETVFFETDTYANNKRLYVGLMGFNEEFKYPEPYCDVTVNIPSYPLSSEECAFIDTNNAPFIVELLTRYHCGKFTGKYAYSGFCSYPEFRFNMEKLKKYTGIKSANL